MGKFIWKVKTSGDCILHGHGCLLVGFFFTCLQSDQWTGKAAGIQLERIGVVGVTWGVRCHGGSEERGREQTQAQVPTVSPGTQVWTRLPGTQMFFIVCFQLRCSQKDCEGINNNTKNSSWLVSIDQNGEDCPTLWVYPGGYLPRPWL